MTGVLFVCTGNVYRSALAERLLAARLGPGSAVRSGSAGTEAWHRAGMDGATRRVLEELGGDGADFASRPLAAPLVADAALVLGLAREHREAAVRLVPAALRRCFTLKEFLRLAAGAEVPPGGAAAAVAAVAARRGRVAAVAPEEDDIADPWGRPHHELYACAREIDGQVTRLVRVLQGPGTTV
ncbi:low molecular weight phosphatase family protein [Streptomyces sp. NPDC052040]|uniref:arsenate reductase/protein-tyrosine-phosphatase family protein n=1 Tax=Streptomyces sp. NPDC052040 TaxID=3365682 RepID=UPI0037CDCBEF